jgi:hypothetical protein
MTSRALVAQPAVTREPQQESARFALARQAAFQDETDQQESAIASGPPPWPVQARLQVGGVDDPLEREADRVAERVMRMPAAVSVSASSGGEIVRRTCASCAREDDDGMTVRRMCRSCSDEADREEQAELSRKERGGASTLAGTAAPPIVREVVRSPGRPLDPATRAFFEPRFGHDFSQVRIHSDGRAAASAQAVNAVAYTVGKNVVFGAARYAPHTASGRGLLAHELAHVVQQDGSSHRRPVVQRQASVTVDPDATCNLDQHRKIEPAAHKASEWLSRAIPAVEAFLAGAQTPQANAAGAALWKHFHSVEPAVASYVRDRLTTIRGDLFGRQNFRVNCPPASDRECNRGSTGQAFVAVVPEGNPNEINLCAPFFRRSLEDDASTIIHEFGHTHLGLTARQAIVDRAYQGDVYYYYLTTGEALTNAESYAMLAREIATGSSNTKGFIADSYRKCPDAWFPIITDALIKARTWNHGAVQFSTGNEFRMAFIKLDIRLWSGQTFKCIPDGGGRCSPNVVAYWYAAGDLRICPALIALPTPEARGLAMLASLYAFEGLVKGDARQDRAAREARRLHTTNVPSTADVLGGRP